ncbi:MAG: CapA family protein [Synergistaceae bacterium]|nr:CapA family protein [Synergistaceae bacterium]MBQ9594424.1 CapA family protein [Synergistaceae bacterium]
MKAKLFLSLVISLIFVSGLYAETRARFLFIGDIMAHQQQLDAARYKGRDKALRNTYDFSPQFRRVKPLFSDTFLVGNLETVFAGTQQGKRKINYSGYPMFNTPDSLIDTLSNDLEVDLLTLANNHIFDKGAEGARRTTEVLDSADLAWTGLGLDDIPSNDAYILENDGITAAFVNYTYGSNLWPKDNKDVHLNTISDKNIIAGLERAKTLKPDVIIACFHWGNEYHFKPSTHQINAANTAFDNGADLLIGTHPHVLQPVEVRIDENNNVKAVAWSLGNFVSFQRTLPRERTYILSAEFVKDDSGNTRLAKLGAAPLYVVAPGQKRTEVTYSGTDENTIEKLDFKGLSKSMLAKIRKTGKAVLEFLGAREEVDEYGFYTLWTEEEPEKLPVSKRKSPRD